MRILCVIDSLGSGGAQRQLVNLAIAFSETGNEVILLVYHSHDFYGDLLFNSGIKVNEVNEPHYFLRLLKMRNIIRASNPDVVLSYLDAPNFISELAGLPRRKWRLIVSERSANPNLQRSLKNLIIKQFHTLADYVVTNTEANKLIIKNIVPCLKASKLHVIYNAVDLNTFRPLANYSYRQNGTLHLLVAASHQYLKNLDGLVEAVALLSAQEKSELKISWYGDRRDDSFDKAIYKIDCLKLKEIFNFYPAVQEINQIIQNADVIGIFSFYEGLSNSLCEAMASGKPVISSAVGDLPLHVRNDRMLFLPGDPQSIAQVLRYLLQLSKEDLKALGHNNYLYACQNFARDHVVNQYIELFRST